MPIARIERQWPGGPVKGIFTARYGPDNIWLDSFTLTARRRGRARHAGRGPARLDAIYTQAYRQGLLEPDATLSIDHPAIDPALAGLIAQGEQQRAAEEQRVEAQSRAAADMALNPGALLGPEAAIDGPGALPGSPCASTRPLRHEKPRPTASAVTVQFASPDAQAVDAALAGVRATPGVASAATTSIAIGGTSVMRVTYAGTLQELAAALRARGWQVSVAGNVLRIRR